MGLKNAPSIFQRNMTRLFRDIPEVRIFIDDGVVGGATVEELYLNLRKVMDILKQNRLIMKKSKLAFFKTSLSFLGHVVSREGISPQIEKVEAVRNWPLPVTRRMYAHSWVWSSSTPPLSTTVARRCNPLSL